MTSRQLANAISVAVLLIAMSAGRRPAGHTSSEGVEIRDRLEEECADQIEFLAFWVGEVT
jgi:hypothetical protein